MQHRTIKFAAAAVVLATPALAFAQELPAVVPSSALEDTTPLAAQPTYLPDVTVNLEGTVSDFDPDAETSSLQLSVPLPNGNLIDWRLELPAEGVLASRGWTFASLKPGTRIKLQVMPRSDGSNGGFVTAATRADGKPIGKPLKS